MEVMIPNKVARFFMAHGVYEIYNALHSLGWLESEARAVARWRSSQVKSFLC